MERGVQHSTLELGTTNFVIGSNESFLLQWSCSPVLFKHCWRNRTHNLKKHYGEFSGGPDSVFLLLRGLGSISGWGNQATASHVEQSQKKKGKGKGKENFLLFPDLCMKARFHQFCCLAPPPPMQVTNNPVSEEHNLKIPSTTANSSFDRSRNLGPEIKKLLHDPQIPPLSFWEEQTSYSFWKEKTCFNHM